MKKDQPNKNNITIDEARFLQEKYFSQLQKEILKARCEGLGLWYSWDD